jgi:3-deoxy-D-manno-oct-2-ulosonic acid (Kdo) hydroxylase
MASQVRQFGAHADAAAVLEAGDVLWQPRGFFAIQEREQPLFSPVVLAGGKNVSFDPATGRLGGSALTGELSQTLRAMLARFSDESYTFVTRVCPRYTVRLTRGRTSFRPVEIAGRPSSWRKDDTRLHVDAFPATPVQGRRILRVFANVNPNGKSRTWRVGDSFGAVADYFAPRLRAPFPWSGALLRLLHVTKSTRSPYDALMLQLHDRMKEDEAYQQRAPQTTFDFPAGSAWTVFTDQVSHAAMAGQYQLEQTFLLPVDAMVDSEGSPLRILEKIKGRRLA